MPLVCKTRTLIPCSQLKATDSTGLSKHIFLVLKSPRLEELYDPIKSFFKHFIRSLKLTAQQTMLVYYMLQKIAISESKKECIDFSKDNQKYMHAFFKMKPFKKLREYVKFIDVAPKSFSFCGETIYLK